MHLVCNWQLPPLRGMENPDEEFDVEKDWPVVTQEEYDANPSAYRELCWDLKVGTLTTFGAGIRR